MTDIPDEIFLDVARYSSDSFIIMRPSVVEDF